MRLKRKPIYIVGIVLVTLILVADLALFFLIPAGGSRGELPDFDRESLEGMLPDGFDPESFDGQMPGDGNFDFGDLTGEIPEGFENASRPDRGQMGSMAGGGILNTIRSGFWPILIACVLGDALCVFLLIRTSGKKEDGEALEDDGEPPRRTHGNTWLAIIAVILAGAVIVTGLPGREAGGSMEAEAAIEEAEAERNDISGVFSGSGTLQSGDAYEMEVPVTVAVTSYTVKNGDLVEAGDVIARVDKNSVLLALHEVQTLIGDMDEELTQVRDDTLDSTITARADGRVKAIYVAEGDSVASAMYDNGALLLISLGGSMTVRIESEEAVSVGQTLTVILSDGAQIEGKVQQTRDGKITITTTDDGPTPGDTVTVAAQDGRVLGTGTLEVSSPLKVTGFSGTVGAVRVKVGDKVSVGDTLLTLADRADLARYQQLLRERQELTELAAALTQMYQEGCIKAAQSGIVSQIDEAAAYSPLSAEGGASVSGLAAASGSESYGVTLLSNVVVAPPEATPSTEETTPPTDPAQPPAQTDPDGTYAGKVTKVTYGTLQIQISEQDVTGMSIAALETMDEALFTVTKAYSPGLNVPVVLCQEGQSVPSAISAIQVGDKVLLHIADGAVTQIEFIPGTDVNDPSQGGFPGGGTQSPSSGGFAYQQPDEEEEEEAAYTVEKATLCAIIPAETMTIEVSVDELDILTLAPGQTAAITLDALPGQSFTGSVQRIDPMGVNEGGSTKYTVTMEVPRTEQMLDGMNASVQIEVSRLEYALTVPAAAIYEDGTRCYVYTGIDEKTQELISPVDVTTGASDGTNIEILSGLSEGDTVYYVYADSLTYRTGG